MKHSQIVIFFYVDFVEAKLAGIRKIPMSSKMVTFYEDFIVAILAGIGKNSHY